MILLRVFRLLDGGLLHAATRFAHGFQRLTGRTSFFLAKIAIAMWVLSNMVAIFNYFTPVLSHQGDVVGTIVLRSGVCLLLIWRGVMLDRADESVRSGARVLPRWVKARRESSSLVWRLIWISQSAVELMIWWTLLSKPMWFLEMIRNDIAFSIAAFEYFILVDPLPPGVSRVRQWIRTLAFLPPLVEAKAEG